MPDRPPFPPVPSPYADAEEVQRFLVDFGCSQLQLRREEATEYAQKLRTMNGEVLYMASEDVFRAVYDVGGIQLYARLQSSKYGSVRTSLELKSIV